MKPAQATTSSCPQIGRRAEKGQALILIVVGMVVLLGFTALAIDGGMLYADRRMAQSVSDAASLAGGAAAALELENRYINYENWNCTGNVPAALTAANTAAISRASVNNFTIDADISDNHGVASTCGQETHGAWTDRFIDIRTEITFETRTAFIHFVFSGATRNTVTSITRIRPRSPLVYGNAIVALNDSACDANKNGVIFGGNGTTLVEGGGIFSNGCMRGDGGSFGVHVEGGSGVNYVGQTSGSMVAPPLTQVSPSPSQVSDKLPQDSYRVPLPDCTQVSNYASPPQRRNFSGHLPAGNYSEITLKDTVTLEGGGLYCVYGDFDTGNATVTIDTSGGKRGVTIFLVDKVLTDNNTSDFTTSGNGTVVLDAPPADPDPAPALPGILVYAHPDNKALIKLRGNSSSDYTGAILAPAGRIDVAGTERVNKTFHTQLIGYDVQITGNATVDIRYSGAENYMKPTALELFK